MFPKPPIDRDCRSTGLAGAVHARYLHAMQRILACAILFAVCAGVVVAGGGSEDDTIAVVVQELPDTIVVEHAFGRTSVPQRPTRVVALGEEGLLLDLIELGITPVFSIVNEPDSVPLLSEEERGSVVLVRSADGVSLEMILALEPDLILGNRFFIERGGYRRLAAIAPTVAIAAGTPLEAFAQTAAVLGLREEAQVRTDEFRERVEATAGELNVDGTPVSVASVYPGRNIALWFGGPQPGPELLTTLGARIVPDPQRTDGLRVRNGRAFISEERLDLVQGDYLVLLQSESVAGEEQSLSELQDDPVWQTIPAVRNGNVHVVDRIGYPGFRGQVALLERVESIFRR